MALIVTKSEGPGTHALLIGVGGYPALGNVAFSAPGLGVGLIWDWLLREFHNPALPLASVDLLVSGQAAELGALVGQPLPSDLAGGEGAADFRPTQAAVQQAIATWRSRVGADPANLGILYLAALGFDGGGGSVALFDDAGLADLTSRGAAPISHIVAALDGSGAGKYVCVLDLHDLPGGFLVEIGQGALAGGEPVAPFPAPEPAAGAPVPKRLIVEGRSFRSESWGYDPPPLLALALTNLLRSPGKDGAGGWVKAKDIDVGLRFALTEIYGLEGVPDREMLRTISTSVTEDFVLNLPRPGAVLATDAGTPPGRDGAAEGADADDPAAVTALPGAAEAEAKPVRGGRKGPRKPTASQPAAGKAARAKPGPRSAPVPPAVSPAPPAPRKPAKRDRKPGREDTEFVSDDAEAERDELGRGVLAVALARRLHKIWRKINGLLDGAEPARGADPADDERGAFVVHLDAPWGGGKTTFANFLARVLNPYPGRARRAASFLGENYGDGDLGGIFLDNPPPNTVTGARLAAHHADARRPWIIVPFNAWQAEHCTPPWWVFYQAIRQRCFEAILEEGDDPWRPETRPSYLDSAWRLDARWRAWTRGRPALRRRLDPRLRRAAAGLNRWRHRGRLPNGLRGARSRLRAFDHWLDMWLREYRWRLLNPKIVALLLTAAAGGAMLGLLYLTGAWGPTGEGDSVSAGFVLTSGIGLFAAGLTGISAIWGFGALLTESIMPGTNTLAERLSLGTGDPFDRFRAHFRRMIAIVRRPVMVIVDDLDRCRPDFVVDLVRGIQTLLRSPRVVFVILGDRDWIERAFESHHDKMSKVDVGPEQSFGARFVEKAIQMSFILPGLGEEGRDTYVKRVLAGARAGAPEPEKPIARDTAVELRQVAAQAIAAQASAAGAAPLSLVPIVAVAMEALAAIRPLEGKASKAAERQVSQIVKEEAATSAAVDEHIEAAVAHQLEELSDFFPPNPRQIKRIVNAITMYNAVALQRLSDEPDQDFRFQLALWVIIMTEWPQTWRLLASFPDMVTVLTHDDPIAQTVRADLMLPGSAAATGKAVKAILSDAQLTELITGRRRERDSSGAEGVRRLHDPMDHATLLKLIELTPLHSRRRRLPDEPEPKPDPDSAQGSA